MVPATDADLPFIRATIARLRLDGEAVSADQFLVERDGPEIVAFGRIKPYEGGVYELGSVAVVDSHRGRGLGVCVVEALIKRFPAPDIYITTDLPEFFTRFGFVPIADPPAVIQGKLVRVCATLRENVVAMHHRRPA